MTTRTCKTVGFTAVVDLSSCCGCCWDRSEGTGGMVREEGLSDSQQFLARWALWLRTSKAANSLTNQANPP